MYVTYISVLTELLEPYLLQCTYLYSTGRLQYSLHLSYQWIFDNKYVTMAMQNNQPQKKKKTIQSKKK